MEIRYIEKEDLDEVIEAEAASHYPVMDPDFEVEAVAPWAWTKRDFVSALHQRRNHKEGTFDTRTLVATETVNGEEKVVGAVVLELQDEGYEVLKFTSHPEFPDCRSKLFDHIVKRARRSSYRKKVVINIPDGDWEIVKFFQSRGWEPKLVTQYFDNGNDAWRCEYEAGDFNSGPDLAHC